MPKREELSKGKPQIYSRSYINKKLNLLCEANEKFVIPWPFIHVLWEGTVNYVLLLANQYLAFIISGTKAKHLMENKVSKSFKQV